MAVVNKDPDPPSRAGALWPVIRGLLDHVPARRLGPAEAGRLLREIAESGDGSKTAPLPAALPGKADGGKAERTRQGAASKAPSTPARSGPGTPSRPPMLTPARIADARRSP